MGMQPGADPVSQEFPAVSEEQWEEIQGAADRLERKAELLEERDDWLRGKREESEQWRLDAKTAKTLASDLKLIAKTELDDSTFAQIVADREADWDDLVRRLHRGYQAALKLAYRLADELAEDDSRR
ncbi:MAG: hypothetical protein ACYTKD_13485 [Planctomycetota bacterium]|jgi:hypothetical protein